MNLLVPLKLVPDLVEELTLNDAGTDLDRDALIYKLNEFDDQALEEALVLKETTGATVTVIALDAPDIDQVLFTAIAKGADRAVKVTGDFEPGIDNHAAAQALAGVVRGQQADLVLCGVQAPDDLDGQLGVLLAGALGWPHVSVVSGIEPDSAARVVRCHQEYAGGLMALLETELPAVLGVQAARQPPRYAAVSTIRKAMKEKQIEEVAAAPVDGTTSHLKVRRLFKPESRGHARMLEGDVTRQVEDLVSALSERGVLKVGV
jgi:electron transfer flavoprotein beta subunit